MKRASILFGPPLAFVLAAVAAWLAGPPVGKAGLPDAARLSTKRQREVAAAGFGDPVVIATQLESEMLNHHAVAKEIHHAEGMEATLKMNDRYGSFSSSGMASVGYAIEWSGESPAEMFQWLIHEGGSDFTMRNNAASILFAEWAEKDMETALAAVSKIPDANLRRQALISSLEILCQSDPDRARGLMLKDPDLFSTDSERLGLSSARGRGKATLELFQSLPPGAGRTKLLADLLTSMTWQADSAEHAISVWKDAPEQLRREWVAAGFSVGQEKAASFDGLEEYAREQVEISGDPKSADQFMSMHGANWAIRDLPGSLDWVRTHLKGKSRIERGAGLFKPAAGHDLDTALQVWRTLPDGNLKDLAAKAISDGAPAERKAEVDALLESFSGTD